MNPRFRIRHVLLLTFGCALMAASYRVYRVGMEQRLKSIALLETKGLVSFRTSNGVVPADLSDDVRVSNIAEKIYLPGVELDDKILESLCAVPDVIIVSLNSSNFCDSMVDQLEALSELRELHLNGTAVSSWGVRLLSESHDLEFLTLNDTPVDDAVVEALLKMKNLKRVELYNTAVSQSAIERLRLEMPSCSVGFSATDDSTHLPK